MSAKNKPQRLARRLYIISTVVFAATFIALIVNIVREFNSEDMMGYPTYAYGYKIPVNVQLSVETDTLLKYENARGHVFQLNSYIPNQKGEFRALMNDSTVPKKLLYNEAIIYGKDLLPKTNQLKLSAAECKGTVRAKFTSKQLMLVQMFHHYLYFAMMLYIFWQLCNFFRPLSAAITFKPKTSEYIKKAGIATICYQIICFIISWITRYQFLKIEYNSVTEGPFVSRIEKFVLFPASEFEVGWFFTGLALVAVSYLLQHGIKLEEENQLTV